MRAKRILKMRLRHHADDRVDDLAVFVHLHIWDALHVVLARELRIVGARLDIHFHNIDVAVHVGRKIVQNWCHRTARRAPLCPKIHEHDFVAFQYFFVKFLLCCCIKQCHDSIIPTLPSLYNKRYTRAMNASQKPLTELIDLKGKIVLITGAGRGIGRAIAERYAEAGANVQLIDVIKSDVEKAAKEIADAHHVNTKAFVVDLSDSRAIETFWKRLSPIPDILVNNAGIFWPKKLEHIDDESFAKIININTRAVVYMCREMVKRRHDRPGTIINISSIEAVRGMTDDMLLYGTSKAAVGAITRALVKDYAKKGWKINTIMPGGINTPGATAMGITAIKHLDFSVFETALKFSMRMPTKGIGKPDDIARAALWLGTPMSDFMNGAEVAVDGGFLAV